MTTQPLRIVVGVDFTDTGDIALDEAIGLAVRLEGAELHPVFVIDENARTKLSLVDDELSRAYDRLRARVLARLEAMDAGGAHPVVFHVRLGDPAAAIHQVAVDVDADLVVVGTHGRRGLEKMLLGSVAERLVRTARLPVIVARPKQLDDLPRTPAPDEADPERDLRAPRIMASELVQITKRPSHIAGLV
ncbi:MAG TPA: universal stress protein [Sandaracinaceae bacterium]